MNRLLFFLRVSSFSLAGCCAGERRSRSRMLRVSRICLWHRSNQKQIAKLGFSVVAKTSYGYVTLKSGPVVIALSPVAKIDSHDTASLSKLRHPPVGVEIVLYTTENLEEKHARLRSLGLKPTDIRLQPWGVRDFRITDPGGYYI